MASYFAGALIIPKDNLIEKLTHLFQLKTWQLLQLHKIIISYNCSDETFYQRLTNILPKHFNIKNLFFLRFTHKIDSQEFRLTKELHITQQQAPHANRNNEHYCRRWTSINTIKDLEENPDKKSAYGIQISSYENSKNEYLVLSAATADPFKNEINRSVSIGLLLSPHLKKKLHFFNNDTFATKKVGVTCQTCSIQNCAERIAPPKILSKKLRNLEIEKMRNIIANPQKVMYSILFLFQVALID
mgnify:FL=1